MRLLPLLIVPFLMSACVEGKKHATGAGDFSAFCSGCHGASGDGTGADAAGLAVRPADLTRLSAKNEGRFPGTAVMAKIWGYSDNRDSHAVMPRFAALLESELVPYDGGDGIATPTPLRLVQIAEHLQELQR